MPTIPLISPDTSGPLGVKHLPRLWLKALLAATSELPEGYKVIQPGFDHMALEGIKIDPDAARSFIFENRPTYLEFEQWVREQDGVDLSPENVATVNEVIVSRLKGGDSRLRMLESLGLSEDAPIHDSVTLNNLDDWKSLHDQVAG